MSCPGEVLSELQFRDNNLMISRESEMSRSSSRRVMVLPAEVCRGMYVLSQTEVMSE